MRRRDLIFVLGGAAATGSVSAQTVGRQHRIALVHSAISADQLTETKGPMWVMRFFQTLRDFGYVEGRNLVVDRYSGEGRLDQFAGLTRKVAATSPEVIVTNHNFLTSKFREATTTIPIVAIVADPVHSGLVKSLARPGANLTGVSVDAGFEIYGKQLQIVKEAVTGATKVAFLVSRSAWEGQIGKSISEVGQTLGLSVSDISLPSIDAAQLENAFADIAGRGLQAVVVSPEGDYLAHRHLIVELAAKYRIAAMYPYRDFVELGGLMSYAPDLGDLAKHMAEDVHKILGGVAPGDIPFYQPDRFELLINEKTAKALGLRLPQTLLDRADQVIE